MQSICDFAALEQSAGGNIHQSHKYDRLFLKKLGLVKNTAKPHTLLILGPTKTESFSNTHFQGLIQITNQGKSKLVSFMLLELHLM